MVHKLLGLDPFILGSLYRIVGLVLSRLKDWLVVLVVDESESLNAHLEYLSGHF